ncbi:cilia- and flagella-associated protein 45-like isoform X2 [Bombus vosnesenskii]|uniref:Cilia- and flagella-associated protein 45 n=2 Tax=Pyrobombus TaxID=144703 RepID=A0A6J3L428_9HYME|nr:cilia- and flagella-associated protein 45-like isoform X2 [Bombus vosnesenskii]
MVVQRIGNNTSKSNTICGSPSCSARDRKETKFKDVCSSGLQNTCIRTAECKSGQHRYSYNGKEPTKKIGRSKPRMQLSGQKVIKKRLPPPKILTKEEYDEFQKYSSLTKEERDAALKSEEEERQRLMKESMERKEEFRRIDQGRPREKCPQLAEIEEEARKRAKHVLERAEKMKLEQEEEIQKCNRIILETKCRAIRDAQIAEKKLMELELEEEEKRLNDMMENERRWAIKEEIKKEQDEAVKRQKFANSLIDQIKENEENRILEFERKQEESRLINLNNINWQQEEITKLRNKESENALIRQQLAEGNEQLKHFKAMEKQQNKVIDLRIQEYQRYKEEREAKLAEERRLEKLEKEKAKTTVAIQTLQARGQQERIDELNAARIQEEVERQWRQKEKEEALKKAQAQKLLIKEREKQINNKRIMEAIELERERREFEKIVRVQKEAFCREQKELEKKQRQALIHRSEILKQVNEKERERIEARQKMFEEGLAIRTEAAIRKKKLRDAMERKCEEMRRNRVPEIYINEVKRMISNIQ